MKIFALLPVVALACASSPAVGGEVSGLSHRAGSVLPPSAARRLATENVTEVEAVRLDPKRIGDARLQDASRVAGYEVVPGSARVLSAAQQAEFLAWLGSADGFRDGVVRRCVRGASVGFLIQTSSAPSSEAVVDFGCDTLTLSQGGVRDRSVTRAALDPSRRQILRIVRELFPDDADLAEVQP